MARKFTGSRKRVEGERADHAVSVIAKRGYTVRDHGRLGDDTGYKILTYQGPVINLYDSGSITVTGNNRHLSGEVDSLRLCDTNPGIIIVASNDDEALLLLSMTLHGWGAIVECALFGQDSWMEAVGQARMRGFHVLVFVSSGA